MVCSSTPSMVTSAVSAPGLMAQTARTCIYGHLNEGPIRHACLLQPKSSDL